MAPETAILVRSSTDQGSKRVRLLVRKAKSRCQLMASACCQAPWPLSRRDRLKAMLHLMTKKGTVQKARLHEDRMIVTEADVAGQQGSRVGFHRRLGPKN